jgi:hypothetical protein
MGFRSSCPLDSRLLEGLVVADLDQGEVQLGSDQALAACLMHPHVVMLRARVRSDQIGLKVCLTGS